MLHTYIKICGLTTPKQAKDCAELGADWIGFNCFQKSKRYVTPEKIREMVAALDEKVTTVGVFVNESAERINQIMAYTGMNLAQLHGDESPKYPEGLNCNYFKAFRVASDFDLKKIPTYKANYFLLDSYHPNAYGGTGDVFNWDIAIQAKQMGSLFLAGGLTPENVSTAVQKVKPYGVDVASGVESSPGIKDLSLVKQFIEGVRKGEKNKKAVKF